METEHFDVLVVGAGISGVCAAYHLQNECPRRSYAILEGRTAIGGTWDLFRYPGIRSDSDMYTLGYSFRPWQGPKAIADGSSILEYLQGVVHDYGIDSKIRFGHRVQRAVWSSSDAMWTVDVEHDGTPRQITCNFLFMCSGYYRYEAGYTPEFPGVEGFRGRVVHPQMWTDDVDYAGKRVVVIGSGATAVTLLPALAQRAAHVTMLQRSPTYVVSLPSEDSVANALRRYLPAKLAYALVRWKNVFVGLWFYRFCRRNPQHARKLIGKWLRRELGPSYAVENHFNPRYNPWEQRICAVPDGDMFAAIREGKASVVTDQIQTFTEKGIQLVSGKEIEADLIVTATGLSLQMLGGVEIQVDGKTADIGKTFNYKGMMFSGIPNLALAFGYTNASWTLKAELVCRYVCRLLNHMEKSGTRQCTPRLIEGSVDEEPWTELSSGYIQRAAAMLPKQGSKRPWKLYQNYLLDMLMLEYGSIDDGVMEFSNPIASGQTLLATSG